MSLIAGLILLIIVIYALYICSYIEDCKLKIWLSLFVGIIGIFGELISLLASDIVIYLIRSENIIGLGCLIGIPIGVSIILLSLLLTHYASND